MAMLVGSLAFIDLPLLGWGILDIKGFFHHPARLLYCVIIVLLQVVSVIALPHAGLSRGDGKMPIQRQRTALRMVQFLSSAIVVAAPFSDRRGFAALPDTDLCRYAGLGLFTFGFVYMIWATACLGKQFSVQVTVQEDHELVTDGPYRFVRHPRYLGILIWITGLALVFRSWLALVLLAPLSLVLAWRMHDEETLLRNQFQSDWDAYARRTFRLIPFVY